MSNRAISILLALIFFGSAGGLTCAQDAPTAEDIERAVKRLGDRRFAVREQAMQFLWKAGRAAEAAIEQAAQSDDTEVAFRANYVLERFKFGIFPDTPVEIVGIINQFRFGNVNTKRVSLNRLQELSQHRAIVALMKLEKDESIRAQLVKSVLSNAERQIPLLLVERKDAAAEQLLQWATEIDDTGTFARHYSAYLTMLGKHDQWIAKLQAERRAPLDQSDKRLLAHLLRANGKLKEALSLAEELNDTTLRTDLLFRLRDWKTLAAPELIPGEQGVEKLGFTATLNRRAGNNAAFERAIAEIQRLPEADTKQTWQTAQTLLINERLQDAVNVYAKQDSYVGFKLLREQVRLDEAFKAAGIDDPAKNSARWFAEKAAGLELASTKMTYHVRYGREVARWLYQLGEQEEAIRLLDELEKVAEDKTNFRLRLLFYTERAIGLEERALKHAALALENTAAHKDIFLTLFRGYEATAAIWWKFLCEKFPDEKDHRAKTLRRLQVLLKRTDNGPELGATIEELAQQAEARCAKENTSERSKWLSAIGRLFVLHENPKLAQVYFEKQIQVLRSAIAMWRIGDLLAKQEQWQEAADWYRQAWEADQQNPLTLFLYGRALSNTDEQQAEGQRLMDVANVMSLANVSQRSKLAVGLRVRGLAEEAQRQWDLILRFGRFDAWTGPEAAAVRDAAYHTGEYYADKDHTRAAEAMELRMLHFLTRTYGFRMAESYPRYVHRIHTIRALGLLKAGRVDAAIDEIWQAHAISPAQIELPIAVLTKLEEAKRKDVADELFAKVYQRIEAVCERFPESAMNHNQLAWLAAQCDRRLDDALNHAQQAIKFKSENPAYIDTLAEVHFRRGDRDKAIELEKKAVELDPDNETFQKQLERFQK